jgi:hypothetical protein
LSAVGTLAVLIFATDNLIAGLLSGFAFILSSSVVYYAASGWENVPQTFFISLGTAYVLGQFQRPRGLDSLELGALAYGAAFLLRPDGAIMLVAPGLLLSWRCAKGHYGYFKTIFALALMLIAYFMVHLYLYNTIFPNTFYLKASPDEIAILTGIRYIEANIISDGIPIYIIYAGIVLWFCRKALRVNEMIVAISLALWITYVVAVGGDVFENGRVLLATLPMALLLLVRLWDITEACTNKGLWLARVALVSLIVVMPAQLAVEMFTAFRCRYPTTVAARCEPYAHSVRRIGSRLSETSTAAKRWRNRSICCGCVTILHARFSHRRFFG